MSRYTNLQIGDDKDTDGLERRENRLLGLVERVLRFFYVRNTTNHLSPRIHFEQFCHTMIRFRQCQFNMKPKVAPTYFPVKVPFEGHVHEMTTYHLVQCPSVPDFPWSME